MCCCRSAVTEKGDGYIISLLYWGLLRPQRPLTSFFEYLAKDLEGGIDRGHAAVGGALEKHLGELPRIAADVQSGIDVELQFIGGPRRR